MRIHFISAPSSVGKWAFRQAGIVRILEIGCERGYCFNVGIAKRDLRK